MTPFEALTAATKRAKSQSALARICGCSQTAVWKMFQAKRLSTQYVLLANAPKSSGLMKISHISWLSLKRRSAMRCDWPH